MHQIPTAPYLTAEEKKQLLEMNDFQALIEVAAHWAWIVFALLLPYFFLNPLTVLLSLFILGGKQLACAILLHDASHYSVFSNKKLNDWVGNWLGAYPIFQNMLAYRPYHKIHHLYTGLEEDPDLLLTRGYPTSKKSMLRKFFRDLSGQTGVKAFLGLVLMRLGYLEYNLGNKVVKIAQEDRSWGEFLQIFITKLWQPIVANFFIFVLLYLLASGWLYLLWVTAYLTTFQFCIRVRSMAEHSVVEDTTNPILNTRTTYANRLERMLFAPYYVNYHVEHHLLMGVPSYNLPQLHQIIKKRGFYEQGVLAANYWQVIKMAIKEK
ncbi:fatty acid desaturase family protein [Aureispira anguillae]|uniref:Fatty acid desaturase family protein n=1 Tax=Aureispira anguillae TaxID=2864201 RepID=A0A916DSY6_9BACT|nr:fatty acid desaturase family protein [Aureispira anguillae]BDS12201.1 fatty acid desaturase family protein [Aureispira anguillae]